MASPRTEATRELSRTEWIVFFFLLVAALVLVFVYFRVRPLGPSDSGRAFDLVNPMLDAQVEECVLLKPSTGSGTPVCIRVTEPGVVLRPRKGPPRLGTYGDLRRRRPYLATGIRFPPPGRTCADVVGEREEVELFGLNDFGLPYGLDVALQSIRALSVEIGGHHHFVYQAELRQYGLAARQWYVALEEDAPVTGTVLRRNDKPHGIDTTLFFPAEDCR